ncbi:MAG: exo-alpha-sialidase [Actinomycetota bacterium]|nr:exo-alpha-sialidase [Actinomycetota bacterium]MDQ3716565.1 exo-alpha-sialidase [Actinomycetota bacterium]
MNRQKVLTATLALGVLLLAPPSAGAQDRAQGREGIDVVVEAPRQVTGNESPVRLFNIPALAVHPDDPLTVVMAVGDARNGGCGIRVSRDGGMSWAATAPNFMPSDLPFCHQRPLFPVMAPAFAPDGTLYVAMPGSSPETGHPNGPISMLVARSDDLGETYEVVTVLESERITVDPAEFGGEGEPEEANTWNKSPSLVVDPNDPDRLFLGWRWSAWGTDLQGLSGDVPTRPYVAVSEDGGQTWSEPTDLVVSGGDEVYGSSSPMLVIAPDGTLYAFSKESLGPLPALPEGESPPNPRMLMYKSTDDGRTWETSVVQEGGETMRAPQPAVDPRDGDLYVVYGSGGAHASEGEPPPAPQEIYFITSQDGGATWSEPVQITRGGEPADKFEPGISVAPDGRIDVAWHDFRNDPFGPAQLGRFFRGERYWDVYSTFSTDGGATWAPNLRVTETFIDGGIGATFNNKDVRGPIGIASTEDAAYIAWADSRASVDRGSPEDAYFSRLRVGDTEVDVGAVSNSWLWAVLGGGVALALAGLALIMLWFGLRRRQAAAGGDGHGRPFAEPAAVGH